LQKDAGVCHARRAFEALILQLDFTRPVPDLIEACIPNRTIQVGTRRTVDVDIAAQQSFEHLMQQVLGGCE
jgi:hypothetical protein